MGIHPVLEMKFLLIVAMCLAACWAADGVETSVDEVETSVAEREEGEVECDCKKCWTSGYYNPHAACCNKCGDPKCGSPYSCRYTYYKEKCFRYCYLWCNCEYCATRKYSGRHP